MWIGPNAGPVFFSFGVVLLIACWMYWRELQALLTRVFGPIADRYFTSSNRGALPDNSADEDYDFVAESAGKGNEKNAGNGIAMRESTENDPFSFPDAFTVAALLIEHNKLSETDVLRVAFGAKAGKKTNAAGDLTRYGAAHAGLQAALAKVRQPEQPQYHELDEQRQVKIIATATKS